MEEELVQERHELKDIDEVRETVKQYVELGADIKEASKAVSELRKRFSEYNKQLFQFMKTNNVPAIKLPDGSRLVIKTTKSRPTVNADHIAKQLERYYEGRPDEIKSLMQFIYSDRPIKTRESLKRVNPTKEKTEKGSVASKYLEDE